MFALLQWRQYVLSKGFPIPFADQVPVMFSVVVLQWITSEKTRPPLAQVHTHYILQKNSISRIRGSAENANGEIQDLPEGPLAMKQRCPSAVDSVGESIECEGRARIHQLGVLPNTLSAVDDISNCVNKSNEREEADQQRQPAVQEVEV